jgi:hypothetical protein
MPGALGSPVFWANLGSPRSTAEMMKLRPFFRFPAWPYVGLVKVTV